MVSSTDALRIVLETDAPYMVPSTIYPSLNLPTNGGRLPISHPGMIPWTAQFVAGQAGEGWDADRVMEVARRNARGVYGV
jgi:TatD DNase family protein